MASPDNSSYNKLVDKLRELFELDKADLDFGIYRIIGQRQDQIDDFLRNQLKNSVAEVLRGAAISQQAELETALVKAEQSARDAGFEPEEAPKVKELQEKLAALGNPQRVEHEVYEHLYRFFSRYYEEGDFISQRRVSRNARYAIPYNGEEVKLHWANSDQYYIKSSENFRDYRFKLTDGRGVHFKLLDADTNRDNTKGDKRFFRLADDTPVADKGDELLIHFHYSTLDEKKITDADGKEKTSSQNVFNGLTLLALSEQLPDAWSEALNALQATNANPKRTLLEKHLNDYTTKNSFDYFIHKDLGGFLRQELDFYIKNEVMFLDDIEDAEAPKVESYLRSLKAIRRVAGKVIDFLAQLENFQKKLWLKKKFVVQCDYCITLDRVPEELYVEIAANEAQIAEWRKWGLVNFSVKIDVDYLQVQQFLMIDTKYYHSEFKLKLLASKEDVDAQCDGLLVSGENFQALNILQNTLRGQVDCVYIDPPYNTGGDGFSYKDNYQHSSWYSMIFDRVRLAKNLMSQSSLISASIDDNELYRLGMVFDDLWGETNRAACAPWRSEPSGGKEKTGLRTGHEYLLIYNNGDSSCISQDERSTGDLNLRDGVGPYRKGRELRKWGGISLRQDRPNQYYPLPAPDGTQAFPIKNDGKEGHWRWGKDNPNVKLAIIDLEYFHWEKSPYDSGVVVDNQSARWTPYEKIRDIKKSIGWSTWLDNFGINADATRGLKDLFGEKNFDTPKPVQLVEWFKNLHANDSALVLDFFAGSGVAAHAVINSNRASGEKSKYVLIDIDKCVNTVISPRIHKLVYSENWKEGTPLAKDKDSTNPYNGISHCFKYMKLV